MIRETIVNDDGGDCEDQSAGSVGLILLRRLEVIHVKLLEQAKTIEVRASVAGL